MITRWAPLMLAACSGRKAVEEGSCGDEEADLFGICLEYGCSGSYSNSASGYDACDAEGGAFSAGGSCAFEGEGSCVVVCDCPLGSAPTETETETEDDADADGWPSATDCDDGDASVHPDADEWCDGVDSDCDGDLTDSDLATWVANDGTKTDMFATLAGTMGAPKEVVLDGAGTLTVCPGLWYAEITASEEVHLQGLGGRDEVVLSAGGNGTVLTVTGPNARVTLDGLTVADGWSVDFGSGVLCEGGGTLGATDVTFTNHEAAFGSAITATECDLELTDAIIADNVTSSGGAVLVDGGEATITGTTFERNIAVGAGGALYANLSTVTVSDSTFRYNEGDSAGAIYVIAATLLMSDSDLAYNAATGLGRSGGAVMVDQFGAANLDGVTFLGNTSDVGGGLYAQFNVTSIVVTDTTFSENVAGTNGGGAYTRADEALFERCLFDDNSASLGGGVFTDGILTLDATTFGGNTPDSVYAGNGASYDWEGDGAISTFCDATSCS